MFDYHVHVTGMPIIDEYKSLVKKNLSESLKKNKITSFLGIISPGSLFTEKDFNNMPPYYAFFDLNAHGLNIVKELGGYPAIRIQIGIPQLNEIFKKIKLNEIQYLKLFYNKQEDKEEELINLITQASDNDIKAILIHTPSNHKLITPIFELVNKKDIQLILGHGCYLSKQLIKQVKDYGFLVDTAINPSSNIQYWIDNEAKQNLVFGSDWPCNPNGYVDWNRQSIELRKLLIVRGLK